MDFQIEDGRIFNVNEVNELMAEATYVPLRDGVVDIDHTFVSPTLRGQGIAGQIMEALAGELRSKVLKATASCSYAEVWLEKNRAANQDIIA